MSEWQPIETAPRDGTSILAFAPDCYGGPTIAVVYWYISRFARYEPVDGGLFQRVEEVSGQYWAGAEETPFDATHWMPLPEPPGGTP